LSINAILCLLRNQYKEEKEQKKSRKAKQNWQPLFQKKNFYEHRVLSSQVIFNSENKFRQKLLLPVLRKTVNNIKGRKKQTTVPHAKWITFQVTLRKL
jgi:hypothetical protein